MDKLLAYCPVEERRTVVETGVSDFENILLPALYEICDRAGQGMTVEAFTVLAAAIIECAYYFGYMRSNDQLMEET